MITTLLILPVVIYALFWVKEKALIDRNSRLHGKFVATSHLSSFEVDGEDHLFWGCKVYLHMYGMVIAAPLSDWQLVIPYREIRLPRLTKREVNFYYQPDGVRPKQFRLLTSLTDNHISIDLANLVSDMKNEVMSC